ncbi:hypothetical protein F5Y16DRAFT_273139 [Xylariaceae sp. FL0255]|nr:hypothetical protein F5Y16DRAFT_273139 [Xylariaceae sp. FL0255]
MLVSRHLDPEQSRWSSKLETAFLKATTPRMSSYNSSLSTQPDWQGHYSFISPGESSIFGQSFEHVSASRHDADILNQQRSSGPQCTKAENQQTLTSNLGATTSHQHTIDPLGFQRAKTENETQPESPIASTTYAIKTESREEPLISSERAPVTLGQDISSAVPSVDQVQPIGLGIDQNDDINLGKEEEEEVVDDDDMVEGDGDVEGEGEGGDEAPRPPQTAAERNAARRKMKRFRLTHQQTRFLMSEFAKQPHPDAAHRERLSREIPGLSPRQVQVWFQNRRAKIKRMTADDRDRMIKMRAVPDDFDNVQALHSPYGAVHALGTPITPPVDFGSSSYSDHIMRPLLLDTMRRDNEDHLSPTGLSPAFGNIGFTHSGTMTSSDILSPLSPSASNDRGYYSSLTSPLTGSTRASNPFARQGSSLDQSLQLHSQSRQNIRPLQPLSLRETMTRSRSDNLQSPLRSSMSWKGDSIDYSTYSGTSTSPGLANRHTSLYQSDQIGSSSGLGLNYDASSFSGSSMPSSSTNINYSSLQQPSQTRSRLRTTSATLPLGLDLRHQYRSMSSTHSLQPSSHSSTPRPASSTPFGTSSNYSSSFPSAPLTAPIDFSLPRTPGIRGTVHDYSIPQLSAPIAPSQDFAQALHGSLNTSSAQTPMRDTFSGGPLSIGSGHGPGAKSEDYSQDEFGGPGASLKRKRSSFSLSQSSHPSGTSRGSQPYGHTS